MFPNFWNVALFGIAVGVIAFVLFPVVAPTWHGNRRAYQQVLSRHRPDQAPQWHKQKAFLYLSWFPQGRPQYALNLAVYPDGTFRGNRILWNYATQGNAGGKLDTTALDTLEQMPALPVGQADPDAVSYDRLLIVSQEQTGRWVTRYYDRSHLPAPVRRLVQITGIQWKRR